MPDTGPMPCDLNDLLGPYEARPITRLHADIEAHQRDLSLGWELSRLQGATMTDGWRRLFELYANGQISRDEYRSLGLRLARAGALSSKASVNV